MNSISALLEALPKRETKLPQDYYDTRATVARDLAFTVSGIHQLDAIQTILDSLDANNAAGGSFGDWKKQIKAGGEMAELPKHRVELVFRNHAQTAYAAGKCKNFETNAKARPYLMYSAIGDSRTRPAHMTMDGVIRPVGDAWWRSHMPPNGHNCRCGVVALTEAQAKARGGITENPPDGHDAGWGYSPCTDRVAGESQSLARKVEQYHPRLRGFVDLLKTGLAAVMLMLGL